MLKAQASKLQNSQLRRRIPETARLLKTWDKVLETPEEVIERHVDRKIKFIEKPRKQSEADERKFRREQPQHVRHVQRERKHVLIKILHKPRKPSGRQQEWERQSDQEPEKSTKKR